ncbi:MULTISPECIES: amidohydrolase [Bosea]|uniref:amidohydrolase n=1 Tax=Bosea TaxID=85413 RepID=UPI00214F95C5|nr:MULTISPECIES: amidohydrolase [Bosea]MCR4522829.1 amidohydrolase [Bosea sp. 47.2.35]MDR6826600.1 putative amidohydrolase YtcJ [Bosea robiniae]MDR6893310.1 putative amidohydrolase YtcJ [Bosea sp. BE109]MDR7136991.1 putative amidohydrolase YtcJ [Bosea sp. BE168]MDR7173690.1 putative amidohydrolase YtcJ [Bosea sp. BE271]
MAIQADIVLRNGPIWCGREEGVVEALAIFRDKVLAAGSDAEIRPLIGPKTRVIDLKGRLATPGLNDSHLHLVSLGMTMGWVDSKPESAPTLEALLGAISARAAQSKPGEWILSRGYDQTKLDTGRHPYREELDRAAPNNPVMLVRACGHIAICNSEALRLGGIDETSPTPQGGLIEQQNGRLTGLLAENARAPVQAAIPAATEEDIIAGIERGGQYLLSLGITSCMDAAVGQKGGFREIAAYHRAKRDGRLPVRTWLTLLGDDGRSIVPECYAAGLISGTGDEMLMIGGVKLFLDGSAGGRTAWMTEPYLGDDKTTGVWMWEDAELERMVLDAHRKGYQLVCHAIGDAAIEQLITAYEKALAAYPDPHRRHRIEHCGFSTPAQHERMVKAGIYPCPQQVFIHDFGDAYVKVLGPERAMPSYPFRTWFDLGLKPATGSDAPVCDPNPFPNFHTMLTRETWKGTVMDESQRVSIEEALQAYTEFGAFSQKQEKVKGRLAPGFLADVAVFSRDLLSAAPADILKDTRCDLTILGGEVVFERS